MPDSSTFLAIFDNNAYSNTFSYPYVDASLVTRDGSINYLYGHTGGFLYALGDVNINTVANKQYLEYNTSTTKWRNRDSMDITTVFYTKTEIDAKLAQVIGGTYH